MNMIDFVTLVREMRQAQKDYYQFRCAQTLGLAKSLERRVDVALEEGVVVYATATLENMNSAPAEGEQLGMFEEPDAMDVKVFQEAAIQEVIALAEEYGHSALAEKARLELDGAGSKIADYLRAHWQDLHAGCRSALPVAGEIQPRIDLSGE